jgi:putative ABC transport system permease protein
VVKGLSLKRRRDIREQRWQFVAVLITIVLGVMMFAASYDAYRNLTISYGGTYDRLAFADATVIGSTDGLAAALREVDGVAEVTERRQADVPMQVGEDVFVGRVVSIPLGEQPAVDRVDVIEGAYPDGSSEGLVETHMAAQFDMGSGDTARVLAASGPVEVAVVGEAVSPEYLWPARSSQQFFEPPKQFGVVFVAPDVLDAIDPAQVVPQTLVLYEDDADREAVGDEVRDVAIGLGASDVVLQEDQPSNKALELDVTGFEQMAVFFPAMFLLVAGMAAYTLLTRVVYSQQSVIGTLRANGFGQGEVVRHYLSFGLWLGAVGAALGIVAGLPAGWAITAAYTAELGIPDTIREFRLITPVVGVAFGLAVGVLSAWIPARTAVRLSPADAIRGDASARPGGLSAIERIIPPLRRAPVQARMVMRSIGRSKRRSLSVIVAIILAVTLVFSAWGMVDTVTILLDRHFTQVQVQDVDIVTAVPVDDSTIAAIEDVPGVRRAEPVVALECVAEGPDGTYSTTLFAYEQDTEVHGFVNESGELPADGALVGEAITDEIGIAVGDAARLSLPGLGAEFEVTARDAVTEPMGSPVYVARDVLEEALRDEGVQAPGARLAQPGISIVQAVLEDGADREEAIEEIGDLEQVVSASDAQAIYDLLQDYMGLFYLLVGMMLAFGGVLALALIFNVISVNLAERIGELATMRANGLSHRRIGVFVLAENTMLTAMGVVPGMAVAYAAASWLMSTYTSDMLSFDLETHPSTLVLSALSMFLVTAVSLWPGVRAVRNLDIATEVRERSQ